MANVLHTSVAGPDGGLTHIRNFINSTLTGWTIHQDNVDPGAGQNSAGGRLLVASKGDVLVGIRSTTTGSSNGNLHLFDGVPPWTTPVNADSLPGNSGIRVTNTQYDDTTGAWRFWNEVGGTWPRMWIFGNNSPSYVHVVAEISTDIFYHMHFGELTKIGTWTGGAYYGADFWGRGLTAIDDPGSTTHTVSFDGASPSSGKATTVHCATTVPTSSWLGLQEGSDITLNSVQRRMGECGPLRGGWGLEWWQPNAAPMNGQVPLYPIHIFYRDTAPTPDAMHHLGYVTDLRVLNINALQPAQDLSIGGDTWRAFPLKRKNGADNTFNSGFYGLAYRVF